MTNATVAAAAAELGQDPDSIIKVEPATNPANPHHNARITYFSGSIVPAHLDLYAATSEAATAPAGGETGEGAPPAAAAGYADYTVAELDTILEARGLDTTGKKADKIARLEAADTEAADPTGSEPNPS